MIPIRHTIPRHAPPLVTRGLVVANVVVFTAQLLMGPATERIIQTFGFIPVRLFHPGAFDYAAWEAVVTLLTSLFLHGGFVHLFGNLIYLWVFGGPVEDMLGHGRYLAFYVACGVFGSLNHAMLYSDSLVPSIGASGSIAGVLGAFLVIRPRARIVTLLPLVVYWAMIEVRAALFLPIWFGMQFFNGFLSIASARGTEQVAGVAWWAHVGGFLIGAGVAAVHRFSRSRRWRRVQP